ncbi:MAG: ASPIC/UnbV domain-containing protein, partial [Bacteroidota bacterium]
DYDLDGDLDFYFSNTTEGNPLLINNSDGTFTEADSLVGVRYNLVGWGVNFLDYDNDADPDLYVSGAMPILRMQSRLFENLANGYFDTVPAAALPGDTTYSFGNALLDFNQDGALDIAVSNKGPDKQHLWQNAGGGGNYLQIIPRGTLSNRDGFGTWIHVFTNGLEQIHYTTSAISFVSQNAQRAHFGLGTATTVDSVVLRWPSGLVDRYTNVAANQALTYIEGNSLIAVAEAAASKLRVYPQPAGDALHFDWPAGAVQWELRDLRGKVLRKGGPPENGVRVTLKRGNLAAGTYLLRVEGAQNQRRIVLFH